MKLRLQRELDIFDSSRYLEAEGFGLYYQKDSWKILLEGLENIVVWLGALVKDKSFCVKRKK